MPSQCRRQFWNCWVGGKRPHQNLHRVCPYTYHIESVSCLRWLLGFPEGSLLAQRKLFSRHCTASAKTCASRSLEMATLAVDSLSCFKWHEQAQSHVPPALSPAPFPHSWLSDMGALSKHHAHANQLILSHWAGPQVGSGKKMATHIYKTLHKQK